MDKRMIKTENGDEDLPLGNGEIGSLVRFESFENNG